MRVSLSTVTWILGGVSIGLRLPGVLWPEAYGRVARRFPRHLPTGAVLAAAAAVWIAWYLNQGVTGPWAWLRPYALLSVPVGYAIAVMYLGDYLPVRALAVLMLLVAKVLVDSARWHPSAWRLVIPVIAYLWVIVAMWLVISPYRMRDMIQWATSRPARTRALCALGVAGGIALCILAATVYRV